MTFDFATIDDFDKHIELSIPNYSGLQDVLTALFKEYMPPRGLCVDLGCSTGSLIKKLRDEVDANYIGIDVIKMPHACDFRFLQMNAASYLVGEKFCDAVFSIFTLQFLNPTERKETLRELKRLIAQGATVFVAEKFFIDDSRIDSVMRREHYRVKRDGFTDTEIMDKDYQLLGSMFCKKESELLQELKELGSPSRIWQSYNFGAWIIKST